MATTLMLRFRPAALTALLPTLTTHLRPRASPHGSLQVRISIYYTRAPRAGALDALSSLSHPVGLNLRPGRPNLGKHLTETTNAVVLAHSMRHASTGSEQYPCGVIIGTCGPVELGDEAGKAVGSVPWKKWKEVGGVEAYDESVPLFPLTVPVLMPPILRKGCLAGDINVPAPSPSSLAC